MKKKVWKFVLNYVEFYDEKFDEPVNYETAFNTVRSKFTKEEVYKIEPATNYDRFTITTES